jgi:putative ABC transport system permease protein
LVLGVIGIYGVIAYTVRPEDTGNRHSVGAQRRATTTRQDVPAAGHGLALSGAGAAAGLAAALALRRVMSSLLFGIGPMDPAAYAAEVTLEQRTTRGNQQRRDRPIL